MQVPYTLLALIAGYRWPVGLTHQASFITPVKRPFTIFCYAWLQAFGAGSAVAMFSGCIAVGTASGVIFVLMPRSINPADGRATGCEDIGYRV